MPASALDIALAHYRAQQRLKRALLTEARRLWRKLGPGEVRAMGGSWLEARNRLLVLLAAAQTAGARQAEGYVAAVLAAQGIDPEPSGALVPEALAWIASDGRPLDTLLDSAPISMRTAIGEGATEQRAYTSGYATLDMILSTQTADAARVTAGVALTARRRASGYVRMIVGKTCSRCAILAGKFYAFNQGFLRHPRCLVAGTVVSGPALAAATTRWYEGELVIIRTASGKQLTITGNHPILTDCGWLPAHLVDESRHVASSTLAGGALPVSAPDKRQVPAVVEDVWRAGRVLGVVRVPTTTEDFHGDGLNSEVDVVSTDGMLRDRVESTLPEHVTEDLLAVGMEASRLSQRGQSLQLLTAALVGLGRPKHLPVPARPFLSLGDQIGVPVGLRLAGGPALNPRLVQAQTDRAWRHAVPAGEAFSALASQVCIDDVPHGQGEEPLRWDAPADTFTVQNRGAYADVGVDLLGRLAGQVSLDRIIEYRRFGWSGHVFNLSSYEGWYTADGIVVSNCDCIHIPSRESLAGDIQTDPKAYFKSLSRADQDRIFTRAGARAIRDGSDMSRVVNARRGMETAARAQGGTGGRLTTRQVFGRDVFTTTEAVTRRGINREIRLMPEQIYIEAGGNRDEALRLLRLHGYLIT